MQYQYVRETALPRYLVPDMGYHPVSRATKVLTLYYSTTETGTETMDKKKWRTTLYIAA